jgi:hypothetical protein
MGVRVLFSSDLHGNDEHLERLCIMQSTSRR